MENAHINHTTLIDTLSHLLEAEIVLIPWDKYEEYGHADGMVRYMGNGNVLINNYCDFDKSLQKKLLGVLGRHFCVNELHYGTFTKRSWAYLNFLHVGNHIFIPMLGERLDGVAYNQIAESFPECECHPVINCESVVNWQPLEGAIYPTKTKSLFYNLNVWYSWPLWASTSISYHPTTFLFVVALFKPLSKFGARG